MMDGMSCSVKIFWPVMRREEEEGEYSISTGGWP